MKLCFTIVVLLFVFQISALPSIRCKHQNVLGDIEGCTDKKVVQIFCHKCTRAGKFKRFFLDVTKKVEENQDYSKLYQFVCIKKNFFSTSASAHFVDPVYVFWRNLVLRTAKTYEKAFLKTLQSKEGVNQKCLQFAIEKGLTPSDTLVFKSLYNIMEKFRGFQKICGDKADLDKVQRKIKRYMKNFIKTEKYYKKFRERKDYEGYKKLRYFITMFRIVMRYILTFEDKLRKRRSFCSVGQFLLVNKFVKKVGKKGFLASSGISKNFDFKKTIEQLSEQRASQCAACPFKKSKKKKMEKIDVDDQQKIADFTQFLDLVNYRRTKRMIKRFIRIAEEKLITRRYLLQSKKKFLGEDVVLEILEILE
eukprot:gene10863-3481_t